MRISDWSSDVCSSDLDTVLAVGDRVFQTWDGMQMALLPHALDREDVELRVRDAGGHERVRELELSALPEGLDERSVLSGIGLTARQALLPPVVGKVRPDTPAWSVLAENDRITAINGQPVGCFDDIGRSEEHTSELQ